MPTTSQKHWHCPWADRRAVVEQFCVEGTASMSRTGCGLAKSTLRRLARRSSAGAAVIKSLLLAVSILVVGTAAAGAAGSNTTQPPAPPTPPPLTPQVYPTNFPPTSNVGDAM